MAMYSIGISGLIISLNANARDTLQAWFADDSAGAGTIEAVKVWWDHLNEVGPSFGYYPKACKSYIVVKDERIRQKALAVFQGEAINITIDGERHIGAVIGSQSHKESFVKSKVDRWVKDIRELSGIAKEEPQAALVSFNAGVSQRWKFLQRTVSDISQMLTPLEAAIRDEFIPAVCGRHVSDIEREILSLPCRHGGLGIVNPIETS